MHRDEFDDVLALGWVLTDHMGHSSPYGLAPQNRVLIS